MKQNDYFGDYCKTKLIQQPDMKKIKFQILINVCWSRDLIQKKIQNYAINSTFPHLCKKTNQQISKMKTNQQFKIKKN